MTTLSGRKQETKEWNDRTARILSERKEKGEKQHRLAVWGPSARLAIKKQAAQTMAKLAMPKAVCDSVRGRMMRVLLEEHDTILKSFWAQKLGTKAVEMRLRGPRQCRAS